MSVLTLGLLRELEDFLTKDLSGEKLTHKCKNKVKVLLGRITECMRYIHEQEKLDQFLTQQRREAQVVNTAKEADKAKNGNDADDEDNFYMDLSSVRPDSHSSPTNDDDADGALSGGSGSGYESYDSDGDLPNRSKIPKEEENLDKYFTMPEYSVFSYVYIEIKSMFKGKSWHKRVGVVKEKHFLCYKKPTDSTAITNFPLRAYNCTLTNKDPFVLVTFSETGGHEYFRFYTDRESSLEWANVLKDVTMSFKDETHSSGPPPPVAARPFNSLPGAQRGPPPPPPPANRYGPIQRTQSVGVTETVTTDQTPHKDHGSPPPVSPGNTHLNISSPHHIGKGLKTAVTDIFKKDKTKKRMMTAENLGADISGNLCVFDNKWNKKWCLIRNNELYVYGKDERPELQLQLPGCTVLPASENPANKFGFKILKDGNEVVFMEATSITEMGKWVELLIAAMRVAPSPDTEPLCLPNTSTTATTKPTEKDTEANSDNNNEDGYMDLSDVYHDEMLVSKTRSSKLHPQSPKLSHHKRIGSRTGSKDNAKEDNGATKPAQKKEKNKKKEKKRQLTTLDITLPTEVTQMPEIETVERTLVNAVAKQHNKKDNGNADANGEKLTKEMRTRKADIKTQLLSLNVKRDELRKYIEASSSDKERARLKMSLQKVTDEYSTLEKEDVIVRCKLRELKHAASRDDEAPKAKTTNELTPIKTKGTKSVLARAQMWEAANKD